MIKPIIIITVLLQTVKASGLLEIYALAEKNDAEFQVAESQLNVELQEAPITRANLLPHADITATVTDVSQEVDGFNLGVLGANIDFTEYGYILSVRQAIYHRDYFLALRQANDSVARAKINLEIARQNLIIKTARSYFDVLVAQDTLKFKELELDAIKSQLEQAKRRFDIGLSAITDVKEAQASYDISVANVLRAKNTLKVSKDALELITLQQIDKLNTLSDNIELSSPDPIHVEEWENNAINSNLNVLSNNYTYKIAEDEIKRQRAQFLPTLDLIASFSDFDSGGLTGSFDTQDKRIGLMLNIPIFQGGRRFYEVKQASYEAELATKQNEQLRRAVVQNTRKAYFNVVSGISEAEALNKALISTDSALDAAESGYKIGVGNSLDVLLALQEKYRTKQNYLLAKYAYILNSLLLKQATGSLSTNDVKQIDDWLE